MANTLIKRVRKDIEDNKAYNRSAWKRGVKEYAYELLETLEEGVENGYIDPDDFYSPKLLEKRLLNGAETWKQFSEGGCSLIYDGDIAKRLCCPSELKKCRNGEWNLNRYETWLEVQARSLRAACSLIKETFRKVLTTKASLY